MCVCKEHLHGCWSINAFIKLSNKQRITHPFIDYQSFFDYWFADSPLEDKTHMSWEWSKTNKTVCDHIKDKWSSIKDTLKGLSEDVAVPSLRR